jgi:hypothetical protein
MISYVYDVVRHDVRYRAPTSVFYDIVRLTYDIVRWQESRCCCQSTRCVFARLCLAWLCPPASLVGEKGLAAVTILMQSLVTMLLSIHHSSSCACLKPCLMYPGSCNSVSMPLLAPEPGDPLYLIQLMHLRPQ